MRRSGANVHLAFLAGLLGAVLCFSIRSSAQSSGYERTFPEPKAAVEKILKEMQPSTSGRLPVLDGFATSPADRPIDRYQRGYYQSKFQVTASPSGGSIVRVTVQVTAWYADPVAGKSGYQLLVSNGRLEADLLDQLADQIAANFPHAGSGATVATSKPPKAAPANEPTISAPAPRLPDIRSYSSSSTQSLSAKEQTQPSAKKPGDSSKLDDKTGGPLQTELDSLEDVLKNQAHPKNLVAVKKSGTPVVSSASLSAKTLFLASAHDEFEMLDFNRDWVHVRISGLSRGWIWRNNLEMPESVPDTDAAPAPTPTAAEMFHVLREEEAQFPGDWPPLRGQTVKIVSVEKTDENEKDSSSQLRLEFVKSILEKYYPELAKKSQNLAGIVVIFDSADGGMIAATLSTLQEWRAGSLSDAALWHRCFFDPPESFAGTGASASK